MMGWFTNPLPDVKSTMLTRVYLIDQFKFELNTFSCSKAILQCKSEDNKPSCITVQLANYSYNTHTHTHTHVHIYMYMYCTTHIHGYIVIITHILAIAI